MKFLLFLLPLLSFAAPISIFVPPNGWEAAQPKQLSEHVQIGFVGKGSTDFRPSINLATEEIDCGLKEYLQAVKEVHLAQQNTKWKKLGKIEMKCGQGELTEITSISPWGEVQMFQGIYVDKGKAYILTAAGLKKEFIQFQKELIQSIRSLQLVETLAEAVTEEPLKTQFVSIYDSLGKFSSQEAAETERSEQWKALQKFVLKEAAPLGGYWQFLALKEGYGKIYTREPQ